MQPDAVFDAVLIDAAIANAPARELGRVRLLPGATATLDFQGLERLGNFLAVSTDAPGWVSFYSSAATREADGSRPITQDPSPGSGVLLAIWSPPPLPSQRAADVFEQRQEVQRIGG